MRMRGTARGCSSSPEGTSFICPHRCRDPENQEDPGADHSADANADRGYEPDLGLLR
jgi:hypothetical protein